MKSDIDTENNVTGEVQIESSEAQIEVIEVSEGVSLEKDDLDKAATETDPEATETPTETIADTVAAEVLEGAAADLGQMSENAADTATQPAADDSEATEGGATEAHAPEEGGDVNSVGVEEVGSDEGAVGEEELASEVQVIEEAGDDLPAEGTEGEADGAAAEEGEAAGEAKVEEEAAASTVTGDNAELTAAIEVADGTEEASTSDDVPTQSIALEEATVDETAEVDGPSLIASDDAIVTIMPPTDDDDELPEPSDDVVNADGSTPLPSLAVPSDDVVNSDGVTPISSPRLAKASETSIASNGTLENELAQFSRDMEEPSLSSVDIDEATPVPKSSASNRAANQEALLVEAEELRRQVAELKARENSSTKTLTSADANLSAAERKVKDLQLRIIRSAKEDQEKDRAIAQLEKSLRDLQGELEVARDKGAVEQQQMAAPAQQVPAKSKSCVLL